MATQRPAARYKEEIVVYDYKGRKTARMPEHMLNHLHLRWQMQGKTKRQWNERAGKVELMVRELETGSWDRKDAVEDMGGVY